MSVNLSLDGKVAVVSGGSRGIGAATVKMFCAAGANVLFNYLKAKAEAEKVVAACGSEKHCVAVQADLNGTEGAQELIAAAVARFGRLDALVANHGIWPSDDMPIDQMPDEDRKSVV